MRVQVLVATMNQEDYSLIKNMNIQTDAFIANQCDEFKYENFKYLERNIEFMSFNERGVGLNRNSALMRASADICILADDDVIFVNNYESLVREQFLKNPEADVIIFNLIENPVKRFVIKEKFKVNNFNFMRFGAVRIAFKRDSILKKGINFNLLFGGGTKYGSGEDTLFLRSCLKEKLKIIAVPIYILELKEERPSSWFNGYNEKFFEDKGALYAAISNRWFKLLNMQFCIRHNKKFKTHIRFIEAYKLMNRGAKKYLS